MANNSINGQFFMVFISMVNYNHANYSINVRIRVT